MPNLSNQVYTYYVTLTDFTQLQNFVKLCHKCILLLAKKANFSWIQVSDMNSFYGFKWTCFDETSCGIVVFVIILVEYLQNTYMHFHIFKIIHALYIIYHISFVSSKYIYIFISSFFFFLLFSTYFFLLFYYSSLLFIYISLLLIVSLLVYIT